MKNVKSSWYNLYLLYYLEYNLTGGRQGKLPCLAFEVFDFATSKWTQLPDIPSKRVFPNYVKAGNCIVSVGGLKQPASEGFSQACEVFDTAAENGTYISIYLYIVY